MTRSTFSAATDVAVILILCLASVARAQVPGSLNYQGYLTDADGAAIDGNVEVTFSIYTVETDGAPPPWTRTTTVAVDSGLFSVELGGPGAPFPAGLFETPLYLGVAVDGDAEMVPRRPLTTAAFSFKSDDTLSLQGQGPAAFDQSGHVINTANPHDVTAAQTGGASAGDIAALQSQLDEALAAINQLQIDLAAEVTNRIDAVEAEIMDRIAGDSAEAAARTAADGVHDAAISAIQANSVLALDNVLTLSGGTTALFDGVNLQVVSGSGSTNGSINGLGNLIVGYNAPRPSGSDKSGSHNLVVGDNHNYNSYGGLVAGFQNTISAPFASVSAGLDNTASGLYSSVTGGSGNTASHLYASVSAGLNNTASGNYASVTGGLNNMASDLYASVSGGYSNTASGLYASVSGGAENAASGNFSGISGGQNNIASGDYSSVSGGGSENLGFGNHAYAHYSSILGGSRNWTGDRAGGARTIGERSTISGGAINETRGNNASVSGGSNNIASGGSASVSGGSSNTASGFWASISGGISSIASGDGSSVSGGSDNTASGLHSSVSGGRSGTASGDYDWRAGDLFQDD